MAATVEQLRAIPLFAELETGSLERIAALATELELPAGHVLIERNQPAAGMYVIQDGAVVVELRDRQIECGVGECLGELSLIVEDAARSARVRTVAPVRLLALARRDLEALLEAEPGLALGLLRTVARRLLARDSAAPAG